MLFKVLNLFGLDVPAQIAAARTELEHRVEDAADYAKQATLTAALVAAFSAIAAFLFIVAAGVGLFALYRVIAENYGDYAGMGAVAGLLLRPGLCCFSPPAPKHNRFQNFVLLGDRSPLRRRLKLHPHSSYRRSPKLFR